MYRKLRRIKRRSTVTKRYKRRRIKTRKGAREVKHFTVYTAGPVATQVQYYPAAARTLRSSTITGNDVTYTRGLLSRIQLGTSSGQRIGNSIYGKFISFKMLFWLCPASTDAATYSTASVRVLVHNAPGYFGGADVDYFFDSDTTLPTMSRPERANFNVYYDKLITLNAPLSIAGTGRTGKGIMRQLNFRVPLGRAIEFTDNPGITSQVKKNRDIITLSLVSYSPSVADLTQIACCAYSIRMYFTDP